MGALKDMLNVRMRYSSAISANGQLKERDDETSTKAFNVKQSLAADAAL